MQSVLICSIPNPLSPALSMSTLLKSFVLMMRNYQQMLVRWSLISLCQGCWQAWHEWLPVMTLKSSVSVSHYGETPGGGVHTQLSSVAFFLTLPKHWHLTVSLAMSAETERWNRREAWGSVFNSCITSVVLGTEQLLQQSGSPSCVCRTVMSVLKIQAVTHWKKKT